MGPDRPPGRRRASVALQVGSRLRERRQQADLSRPELAEALGVSVRQLWAYEDGTARASAAMLVRAAKVLGSTVLAFFPNVRRPGSAPRKDSPRSA
ncbi:helix-turn-helix transcriptional regulator [Phenylobacterium sp.]|uniref:helix-turn-helix domain-containing protein n=1 Tax=Phenylobacterium sp. TaxID=1871053 RepID=UPI003452A24A